jgi:hypothetical protein
LRRRRIIDHAQDGVNPACHKGICGGRFEFKETWFRLVFQQRIDRKHGRSGDILIAVLKNRIFQESRSSIVPQEPIRELAFARKIYDRGAL